MPPKLKSLELHGYKTFASLTKFEFPGVVTAVVGPNGSGKSNISDAMRWVLGEQSYSLLRGRKTEDMIFSGSEHRPRSGMASATITFDNSDGWLPIDFSEVAITRRAYRDGQNEYLLNGHRVRLKEISELMSQSGLSERTYTIIGQGLVDVALALKPEERRKLFEEAAGIGLYRSRREEAITRLENTRRNLERVQDILFELEPRIHSLEKQAKRAREYERIKADLRVLMRDWYGYHWQVRQFELTHALAVLSSQEVRLEDARQHRMEVNEQILELRNRMNETREQLNAWFSESAKIQKEREKTSQAVAVLEERHSSLIAQRQQINIDLARLDEERKDYLVRIERTQEEEKGLIKEAAEAQNHLEEANLTYQARRKERDQVEIALHSVRGKVVSIETRIVQKKAHQTELGERVKKLEISLGNVQKLISTGQESIQEVLQSLESAAQEKESAEQETQGLAASQQQLRLKLDEIEKEQRKKISHRSQVMADEVQIKAKLDVLEQAERTLTGLGEGARFLIQATQRGKLGGAFSSLSGMIEVPAEYETAISAALGEYLDLIIIGGGTDPEQALVLLEHEAKGQAVLLPVDWVKPVEKVKKLDDPDWIGIASDFVSHPKELKPMVETLLSRVVVVSDRRAARRLLPQLPIDARTVTLKGELFCSNGLIHSCPKNQTKKNLLSHPRHKRELLTAYEARKAELRQINIDIEQLDRDIAHSTENLSALGKQQQNANRHLDKCREKTRQAALKHEQILRQQEWQTNQKSDLEDQLRRTEAERAGLNKELVDLSEQLSSLKVQIKEFNEIIEKIPLEEQVAQVNQWTTLFAVTSRACKEVRQRVEDFERTLNKRNDQVKALRQRLDECQKGLTSIEEEKENHHQKAADLSGQIEALRIALEPCQEKLDVYEKQYKDLQEIESSAQQAETVAERYHAQAQIDLARQRDSLESLQRRIEDDFGLVAFEYTADLSGPTPLPLEGMVEQLPTLSEIPADLEQNIARLKGQLRRIGAVNPDALSEYDVVKERYDFMTNQISDLRKADTDLRQVIAELDELMKREFKRTFEAVSVEFKQMFSRLFAGGSARLVISDVDKPVEAGIDIEARLPGRRDQGLSLLSGGERSLTAIALIFSLLKVAPTPFCVMDEVDAMLDETNVGRFRDLLEELSEKTQFILITHNRNTVQAADVIYGVTMGRDSTSQVISLRLDEVPEEMVV